MSIQCIELNEGTAGGVTVGEYKSKIGVDYFLSKIETTVRAAVFSLLLLVSIPNAQAGELNVNSINLPAGGVEVTLLSGEKVTLQKSNGEFIIKPNSSSLNLTDHFEGTFTTNGVVFRVISNNVEKGGVSVEEYKSKIGIDYLEYGDMANNFLSGEVEYLDFIEKIIEKKPEKLRGILRKSYNTSWKKALDSVFDGDGQIKGGYLDLFLKKTPNMVSSWKNLDGEYKDIYENQQVTRENQQETKLYNALHRK